MVSLRNTKNMCRQVIGFPNKKMFVYQRVNPGQAKTGCRLKTKVALHGFAKVAHYYKRSLAHTSMTPNMITRCEKQPTSPSAWGLAKK